MEELFNFLYTIFGKVDILLLFINNEISCFFNVLTHDGIHLGEFSACLTTFQLTCKYITCFVKFCRFLALSGNDKWCPSLIDQYGIDLIDQCIVQPSLHKLFFINNHVISQIIKSEFIICHICDVTIICGTSLIIIHAVQYHTYSQSEEFMYLSHPFCITFCQIIIDSYNMYAFSFQCIQIRRQSCDQCLTFTGFHLCNTSLMQDNSTDDLYAVMLHSQHTACRFSHYCISLRENII